MGMTRKLSDVRLLFQHPLAVFLGALAQFTSMPLAALLLGKLFGLPAEIAIGVVLVGGVVALSSEKIMRICQMLGNLLQ